MDSSSTSISRSTASRARASDRDRDDKAGIKLKIPPHKPTRYKEKFQAMREKYDRVTAAHEAYEKDLNTAAVKMKELQDENDLLLDAINVAEPDITRILSPLEHEVNPHMPPQPPPPESRPDNSAAISSRIPHLPSQSPHMNGNSGARHPNGNRHHPEEPDEHDYTPPFAHVSRVVK